MASALSLQSSPAIGAIRHFNSTAATNLPSLTSARDAGIFLKSDERILGDGDFVDDVLKAFEAEELEKKCHYHRHNVDLAKLISVVAKVLKIKEADVCTGDKQPHHVRARSLLYPC